MIADSPVLRTAKWISIAAGFAAILYLLWVFYIYLASEAVIERRYTLPSSLIKASENVDAIAHGKRVITLAGCFGCHGADLAGRTRHIGDFTITASNLRALGPDYTDGDLERAIRRGLTPDARAMWGMPSASYAYMHDGDVEDVIAYIRSLAPKGSPTPRPVFDWRARHAIVAGTLVPASPNADQILMLPDEGPQYDGGRYIATTSCSICHGGDLAGAGDASNLDTATLYTRAQFFDLLRRGIPRDDHRLKTMHSLSKTRFHILYDYEIDALYSYLVARKTLPPVPKPEPTKSGR